MRHAVAAQQQVRGQPVARVQVKHLLDGGSEPLAGQHRLAELDGRRPPPAAPAESSPLRARPGANAPNQAAYRSSRSGSRGALERQLRPPQAEGQRRRQAPEQRRREQRTAAGRPSGSNAYLG